MIGKAIKSFQKYLIIFLLCYSTYIAITTISLYEAAVIVKTIYDGKQLSLHHFPIFSLTRFRLTWHITNMS